MVLTLINLYRRSCTFLIKLHHIMFNQKVPFKRLSILFRLSRVPFLRCIDSKPTLSSCFFDQISEVLIIKIDIISFTLIIDAFQPINYSLLKYWFYNQFFLKFISKFLDFDEIFLVELFIVTFFYAL